MECGWPAFRPDEEGNQILCGVYGTRFVEYLTLRRFDDLDHTPEVYVSHLQDAMRQMWVERRAWCDDDRGDHFRRESAKIARGP